MKFLQIKIPRSLHVLQLGVGVVLAVFIYLNINVYGKATRPTAIREICPDAHPPDGPPADCQIGQQLLEIQQVQSSLLDAVVSLQSCDLSAADILPVLDDVKSASRRMVQLMNSLNVSADGMKEPSVKDIVPEPIVPAQETPNTTDDDISANGARQHQAKVLCLLPCSDKDFNHKSQHVTQTWGKRCDKLIFFTNSDFLGAVGLHQNETGSYDLAMKVRAMFQYVYKTYLDQFEWFLKIDMDSYVIMENLRFLLSDKDYNKPAYFGFPMQVKMYRYMSGGAGYLLSRKALQLFGEYGSTQTWCNGSTIVKFGIEDVVMGTCMRELGVQIGDASDPNGQQTFHLFPVARYLFDDFPDWYANYSMAPISSGLSGISSYAVSFHYVNVTEMYEMEYFIYRLKLHSGPRGKTTTLFDAEKKP